MELPQSNMEGESKRIAKSSDTYGQKLKEGKKEYSCLFNILQKFVVLLSIINFLAFYAQTTKFGFKFIPACGHVLSKAVVLRVPKETHYSNAGSLDFQMTFLTQNFLIWFEFVFVYQDLVRFSAFQEDLTCHIFKTEFCQTQSITLGIFLYY